MATGTSRVYLSLGHSSPGISQGQSFVKIFLAVQFNCRTVLHQDLLFYGDQLGSQVGLFVLFLHVARREEVKYFLIVNFVIVCANFDFR